MQSYWSFRRNEKALLECRLENRVDPDFRFRQEVYKQLLMEPYIHVVDNNGTIQESIEQIRNIIKNG